MAKQKSDSDISKELKMMVEAAKKGAAFGMCLPKKDTSPLAIEYSRKKSGEVLERTAKKEAKGSKSSYGTLSFIAGKIYFQCQVDPPAGLRRKLNMHFSNYGLSVKAAVVDPSGKIDDDGATASGQAQKEQSDIIKVFTPIVNRLKSRFDSFEGLKARTDKLVDQMQKLMEAEAFDLVAAKAILKAAATLEQSTTQSSPQGPYTGSTKDEDALSDSIKALLSIHKKNLPLLATLVERDPTKAEAVDKISNAMNLALAKRPPIEKEVERVVKAAVQLLPKPTPSSDKNDPEKYSLAVSQWVQAANASYKELDTLHKVIAKSCKNMPGEDKVTKVFDSLGTKIKKIETVLNTALEKAVKAGNEQQMDATTKDTLKAVTALKVHLNSDAVLKDIDNNPFQKTQVRTVLDKCLSKIEIALA